MGQYTIGASKPNTAVRLYSAAVPAERACCPALGPDDIRGVSRKPTSIKLLSKVGAQHRENERPDQRRHVGQHALADISRTSRMLKKLPLQHLMEMLLERPPPRRPIAFCSLFNPASKSTPYRLDKSSMMSSVSPISLAIELDPRVLAFRSLSRVVFNHLFVSNPASSSQASSLIANGPAEGSPQWARR